MEVRVTRFDDELYHFGIKGMKWGVRRRSKTSGLSESEPEGYSDRLQRKQDNSYYDYRHAKGIKAKREAKKNLKDVNKESVNAIREYRKWEGSRRLSTKTLNDRVTSDVTMYGKLSGHMDPDRIAKNVAKRTGQGLAIAALAKVGSMTANKMYDSGKIDSVTAKMIRNGSYAAAAYMSIGLASKVSGDLKNEANIKRFDRDVDNILRKRKK